jgi:hypothetical protein
MDEHLGAGYSRSWAHDYVLTELDGMTAQQALDTGVETREVWQAVARVLEVPAV